jgi:ankyrin repeat protein
LNNLFEETFSKIDLIVVPGSMCDFASAGDVENLKLLLNNGVDPNQGDYDRRTPLHLACAEGNERVAELLVSFNADVNFRDRWEGTPLKDAIISGHPLVAESLKAKGARMPKGIGAQEMCTAASRGDVARMRMLLSCGVNLDEGDYDSRSPLHLASSRCPPPSLPLSPVAPP